MPGLRKKLVKQVIGKIFSSWHKGTVDEQRAKQEAMSSLNLPLRGVSYQPVQINHINAEWVRPENPAGTILHLHGGAYVLGSIKTHRTLASNLANATNMQVLLIDYRRAPEFPFPAGLDDVLSAYRWLVDSSISPAEIIFSGDSAGGGLALAALLRLREKQKSLPSGAILLSPWTDLTMTSDSVQTRAGLDPILDCDHLSHTARIYAGDNDLEHPWISPIFADLRGLPPLLVQVGTDEILLDDAVRIAGNAEAAGTSVQLEIYEDMFHAFHMFPFMKESRDAFKSIAEFCQVAVSPAGI